MKALATQFDDRRLSNAVATPTCSSCCCCCCCLATSISASSLLAQRVGKEGERHQVHDRMLLTLAATLFIPITGFLIYIGYWVINTFLSTCTQHSIGSGSDTYSVCTNAGGFAIVPLLITVPVFVLWYLYKRVHVETPLKRAILVMVLISIAFIIEFFAGAALVLTGVGGIAYLIAVPFIIGWISVWYHKHLGNEPGIEAGIAIPMNPLSTTIAQSETPAPVAPHMQLAYPPEQQQTAEQYAQPTIPEVPAPVPSPAPETPEQKPPTPSSRQ